MADDTEDCPSCGGTGGSMGNADPALNWICGNCSGTGQVAKSKPLPPTNGSKPDEPPKEE